MPGFALRHNPKWKTRLTIFLALILPFYVFPSAARAFVPSLAGWIAGTVLLDLTVTLALGFLINNYIFSLLCCLSCNVIELLLPAIGIDRQAAIWVGGLIPALTAIYFVQQLYINMGD